MAGITRQHLLRDGFRHYRQGKLPEAERVAREVLTATPGQADASVLLAHCVAAQGRPDEAAACLEAAVSLNPDSAGLHSELGSLLRGLGRTEQAEEEFRAALRIDPASLPALCNLGELLTARDRFKEALALLRTAHGIAPDQPMAMGTLAAGLVRAGYTSEAIDLLTELLDRHPESAPARITLATALADLGRIEESEQAALTALAGEPRLSAGHWHLGLCSFDRGDLEGAEQAFRAAIRSAPRLALPYAALGAILYSRGNPEAAASALRQAVALDPKFRALNECVDLLGSPRARAALRFGFSATHLRHAMAQPRPAGLVMELGVYTGRSIRLLAQEAPMGATVHGFDSFQGLPGAWKPGLGAGSYDAGVAPSDLPGNVQLHAGWFEETLPPFLREHLEPISLANIDCDTYASTRTFFTECGSRIRPGTILIFDEYFAYDEWREHEFRAFQEFIAQSGLQYRYLALSQFTRQATVRIE